MRDKKDQLHAHLFMVSRLVAAIVRGDPDAHETPLRRSSSGAMGGTALTIVIVGALVVWGLVFPGGNTAWQEDGALVIEKETATRYLYLDGRLHPTLNVASALLASGGGDDEIPSVSTSSLSGVPRSAPLGIVGAPDALPETSDFTQESWSVCAVAPGGLDDVSEPSVLIAIGDDVLTDDAALAGSAGTTSSVDGVLVTTSDNPTRYLVADGFRFRIDDPVVLTALGYDDERPMVVSAAWLNALLPGADLVVPSVAGRGETSDSVAGAPGVVGQVFAVDRVGAGVQHYALERDGLRPITDLETALLLGAADAPVSYPGVTIGAIAASASDLATVPVSDVGAAAISWPATPPTVTTLIESDVPCVQIVGTGDAEGAVSRDSTVYTSIADAVSMPPGSGAPSGLAADLFLSEVGTGVLVQAQPNPDTSTGTLFLVTEVGVKYPLASTEALAALGYDEIAPVWLPAEVLDFLPTGPALDPAAARAVLTIEPIPDV